MDGFWIRLRVLAVAACSMGMLIFLDIPFGSVRFGLAVVSVSCLIYCLYSFHCSFNKLDESCKEENIPQVTASSEAMSTKDMLHSEFRKLVTAIAWHNARTDGELRIRVIKEGETEEKIQISPEDMEVAFLEAAKLVLEKCALDRCPCKTNCDKQTVLQRIRNIRENFEKKS